MKLLSKSEAQTNLKKENEELVDRNIRLRQIYQVILKKIDQAKTDYSPEKAKALKDFEEFCSALQLKKAKVLQEYQQLEASIEAKKDLYYGLIVKQDAIEEKLHQMSESERKLDLREQFVSEIERKQKELTSNYAQTTA